MQFFLFRNRPLRDCSLQIARHAISNLKSNNKCVSVNFVAMLTVETASKKLDFFMIQQKTNHGRAKNLIMLNLNVEKFALFATENS